MLLLSVSVLTSISESISISAVTVTEPKPRTAVFFVRTVENRKRFFGAKWIWFPCPTFVFIYGTKQWVGSGEETESAFKVFSAAKFSHIMPEQLCACFESAS